MALPLYLAMTAAEIRAKTTLPAKLGFMACHFSPYGTGLSNLPRKLPPGTMLILNDRTPIHGHDPELIAGQLAEVVEELGCSCVLLDFQRPGIDETGLLVERIVGTLPCPVGVSDCYGSGVECAVFLPPVLLDVPLTEYLNPWQGREIWLEAALDGEVITLTAEGAAVTPMPWGASSEGHRDENLHCHYHINIEDEQARFTLFRTREDLEELLKEAESLGVSRAVGLWQELN